MRINSFSVVYCSFFIITSMLLVGCGSDTPANDASKKVQARTAKLVQVGAANENDFLNYPAVIKSHELSQLSFEVGGMLTELNVVEAETVKKGDVLAKLDQQDLLAQVSSAQAQYDNADTIYQRALRLIKEDAISKSDLEQRKSQNDVAQSALETAKKALQDSVLVAPFDGAIARVSVKLRQVLQPGGAAITILGNGGLEASINLPSSIVAKAREQQSADDDSYIVLDAAPERRIAIAFKEASLEADTASQTYEITFTFVAPDDLIILPGMNAVVWFKDPSAQVIGANDVSVPLTAIASDGDRKYVWIVDSSSMTVSKRNIVIQPGVGTSVNVVSGLKKGETIVAAGVSVLSDGMKVSPWSK